MRRDKRSSQPARRPGAGLAADPFGASVRRDAPIVLRAYDAAVKSLNENQGPGLTRRTRGLNPIRDLEGAVRAWARRGWR